MYEKSENVKHLQVNDNCTCKCTIQQKCVPSFIGKRHSQTKCLSDFTTRNDSNQLAQLQVLKLLTGFLFNKFDVLFCLDIEQHNRFCLDCVAMQVELYFCCSYMSWSKTT